MSSTDTLLLMGVAALGAFAVSSWAKKPPADTERVAGQPLTQTLTIAGNAPRGIRNRNPGNIKFSTGNNWRGQIGKDSGGFVIFDSDANGLRAMAKLLKTYMTRHGLNTIGSISRRWSPDAVGLSGQYAAAVAKNTGIAATRVIDVNDATALAQIMRGMVMVENGAQYANHYNLNQYMAAVAAA